MNRNEIHTGIVRGILIIASFVILSAASCLRDPAETRFRNLIPEKDFISILNDLHLTNGLLALPSMRTRYMEQDTSSGLYVEIIEGYGYRTGQMDTTIQHYYTRQPKRLIRIYDQMLGRLTEIEARLEKKQLNLPETVFNQWKGSTTYFIPGPGLQEKPCFEITLASPGTFTLVFSVTVYPDDQTCYPNFTAWLSHPDSLETGRRNYLIPIEYIKAGNPHRYTIMGTHTGKESVVLKGCLYDFTSNREGGEPNALIENVAFYYSGTVK